MPFNSFPFLVAYLPGVWLLYFSFARWLGKAPAQWLLILASLAFYAWGVPAHLLVLLASLLVNFFLSRGFANGSFSDAGVLTRRRFFILGLLFNLGLLCFFKYTNFFLRNVAYLTGTPPLLVRVLLPVGISFFTLQQVAFLVDAYQGLIKRLDFREYALFVSFFPKLLNGPIVRMKEVFPALEQPELTPSTLNVCRGLYLLALGLGKKVLLADALANAVAEGFDKPGPIALVEGWVSSLAFTCQLYFDFSGYADMAIGVALLFNVELPANFDSPYSSRNIIEFWKRWHITLSRFITTYIYTPIVQSFAQITFTRAMWATFLAMLIAGLWHGPAWTYVIFGALHGVGLISNHLWKKTKIKMPRLLAWFLTLIYVNFAFVFFRARDFSAAVRVTRAICGFEGVLLPASLESRLGFIKPLGFRFAVPALSVETLYKTLFTLTLCAVILIFGRNSEQQRKGFTLRLRYAVAAGLLVSYSALNLSQVSEFLYFNF